ncbi:MAG: hypothetical protein AAF184_00100 [Pseudomonadota bacterium]
MSAWLTRLRLPLLVASATLLVSGCDVGINESVTIGANESSRGAAVVNGSIDVGEDAEVNGDASTVNGDIRIDNGASVRGANTVNGSVSLGAKATARSIKSVNGDIDLAEEAQLAKSIKLVNGEIGLSPGAKVGGDVDIVAGGVFLRAAQVEGDVSTVVADVELAEQSVIGGDLRVAKPDSGMTDEEQPTIIVGPGSQVKGELIFEAPARVFVSEQAQIGGVRGVLSEADVVRFAGERPPPSS